MIQGTFIKSIIKYKSKNFKNIGKLFEETDFDREMTDEEKTMFLRAYVLHKLNPKEYPKTKSADNFSYELFAGVVAAQAIAAAAARSSSSDSGCGSCGGCGGCGGAD